jgi:hypothetical protein
MLSDEIYRAILQQIKNTNDGITKSCPTTRHEGDWGLRCSSYSLWTSAIDGGKWSESRPGRALAPGKGPPVPIVQEDGWAPESVWTQRLEEKSFRLCLESNLERPVVQPVLTELPGSRWYYTYLNISTSRSYED